MKKLLWLLFIPLIAFGIGGTNTKFATEVMEFFQITTPSSPAATKNKLYFKSDDRLYKLNSAGSEEEIGAGGVGGVNYLADTNDSDFEIDVGNWVAFNDGAVDVPVDGTGGTAVLTCTRNTTTPIRLTGDLKLLAAASDMQGEGCSVDFDIDKGMKAQKLTGLFWLDTSDANYADDDLAVFIYDKTNTQIIRVNGEDIKGGSGKHYFQFQSASDSTSYRLIVMVQSTATLGYSTFFDQVSVGPTNLARGSIITDWKIFTPTFTNFSIGNGTLNAYYRRVGDTMEVQVGAVLGSTSSVSGSIEVDIPNSHTIDTAKISDATNAKVLGLAGFLDSGATRLVGGVVYSTTSAVSIKYLGDALTTKEDYLATSSSAPFTWATSDTFSATFSVPIQGWSSGGVMSSDLGGRDIVVDGAGNGATVLTANVTDIDFIETRDTSSSWDGSSFTAPETGRYAVNGAIHTTVAVVMDIGFYIDGSAIKRITDQDNVAYYAFNSAVNLIKGEVLSFRSAAAATLVNSTNYHHISISKRSSPQTVFETARISLFATNTSGLSIGNAAWTQSTGFTTETDDTGGFASDQYTISENGVYRICTTAHWAFHATGQRGVRIRIDSGDSGIGAFSQTAASLMVAQTGCGIKNLNKEQVIKVEVYQNSGGALLLSAGTDISNSLSISRIK